MVQNTTHQPRNGISQVFSQDPRQVRGCLDYFSIVCIRVTVGSQDLKAISLKKPINLLAKWDRQPCQWPIARQMYQFTQLRLTISQLDSRRIIAGDTPCILPGVNVIQSRRQISERLICCIKPVLVRGL